MQHLLDILIKGGTNLIGEFLLFLLTKIFYEIRIRMLRTQNRFGKVLP